MLHKDNIIGAHRTGRKEEEYDSTRRIGHQAGMQSCHWRWRDTLFLILSSSWLAGWDRIVLGLAPAGGAGAGAGAWHPQCQCQMPVSATRLLSEEVALLGGRSLNRM